MNKQGYIYILVVSNKYANQDIGVFAGRNHYNRPVIYPMSYIQHAKQYKTYRGAHKQMIRLFTEMNCAFVVTMWYSRNWGNDWHPSSMCCAEEHADLYYTK